MAANKQLIRVTARVNSAKIRREQHNGRAHWVIPSYTLPANVIMNDGLYPASEIDAHYKGLEGTLAPLGHPTLNGEFISAFEAEAINAHHIGAFNRNVKKSGNRIYVEKWLDEEFARNTEGGRELIERLEAMEKGEDVPPIHTSVAVFLEELEPNEEQAKQGARWVAKIHAMDHDAILLHEVGAATPEQGVGMMVNADKAQPIKPNQAALIGDSFRNKEQRLDRAAKLQLAPGDDEYAWVADFTDTQAVIVRNGGEARVYDYRIEDGKVIFEGAGTAVERQESWVTAAVNSFKRIFSTHQARPEDKPTEGDMPLTKEEKAELTTEISQAVNKDLGTTIASAMADVLKPITDSIATIQANQDRVEKHITANQVAEEAEKRAAVAKVLGELAANALSGDALDQAFQSIGTSRGLPGQSIQTNSENVGAPDPTTYFPAAQA